MGMKKYHRFPLQNGTLGAQLTAGGTTITFASAPTFTTLAADERIRLIIENEVLYLTAYTAGATTGTVLRGQEGTTDATHVITTPWLHGPTIYDFEKPRVRATRAADLALSANTWTSVAWTAEDYDTHAMHDLVTNNDRLTIVRDGIYRVSAGIQISGNIIIGMRLKMNGSLGLGGVGIPSLPWLQCGAGNPQGLAFSTLLALEATNYLTLEANAIGGAQNLESEYSYFEAEFVTDGIR